MRALATLRRDERGIALVLALGVMIFLGITVTAVIDYTSSNSRASSRDREQVSAMQYAEAGLNSAYSIINYQNTNAANPSAANLLGCNGATGPSDTAGPSNCASPTPKVFCIGVASPCTGGTRGTASVYGYFSGTNPGTYNGVTIPKATWLLISTGYARNASTAKIFSKTAMATVTISTLNSGAVASVWNHVFITSPLVPNQCQLDFSGNNILVDVPVYVIGNFCLSGSGTSVQEVPGGQPIDMMVGGKLVLSGSGAKVGADSSHPITSGVVVGGCTTVSVSSATTPCSPSSFNYWVRTTDTFIANEAPAKTAADMASDWANFDPGPKHTCQSGTSPAPLAASVFDNDTASNLSNEPNNSASSFELTPSSSYSCISQNGASTGQLTWNSTTKKLTVNGSIFIDGNMTVSQSATYTGTAVIEVAGTFTLNGNGTALCATGPPCDFSNWQGSSSNTSMLTIAPLAASGNAITFTNNSQTFQGSLWSQPTASMTFLKNGVTVQGPISVGKFDSTFNNASMKPLPVITNMPVGAPVPPNTGASIGPLVYLK